MLLALWPTVDGSGLASSGGGGFAPPVRRAIAYLRPVERHSRASAEPLILALDVIAPTWSVERAASAPMATPPPAPRPARPAAVPATSIATAMPVLLALDIATPTSVVDSPGSPPDDAPPRDRARLARALAVTARATARLRGRGLWKRRP